VISSFEPIAMASGAPLLKKLGSVLDLGFGEDAVEAGGAEKNGACHGKTD
jgi:hypothetical protein